MFGSGVIGSGAPISCGCDGAAQSGSPSCSLKRQRGKDLWLWEITEPLIPATPKRAQGGGIPRAGDRQVFTAMVFVLTTGCGF